METKRANLIPTIGAKSDVIKRINEARSLVPPSFRVDGLRNNGPGALTIENNVQTPPCIPDIAGRYYARSFYSLSLSRKRVSLRAPFCGSRRARIRGEAAAANFACATIFVCSSIFLDAWYGESARGVHARARKESCSGEPLESSRSNNFLEPLTGLIGDSCVCLSSFVINS